MKISKITITATIPTGQYANIQPSIEYSDIDFGDRAKEEGLKFIKEIWERFGTTPLREVKVKTSADKINEVGL